MEKPSDHLLEFPVRDSIARSTKAFVDRGSALRSSGTSVHQDKDPPPHELAKDELLRSARHACHRDFGPQCA